MLLDMVIPAAQLGSTGAAVAAEVLGVLEATVRTRNMDTVASEELMFMKPVAQNISLAAAEAAVIQANPAVQDLMEEAEGTVTANITTTMIMPMEATQMLNLAIPEQLMDFKAAFISTLSPIQVVEEELNLTGPAGRHPAGKDQLVRAVLVIL